VRRPVSFCGGGRASRKSAASTATAAGSSIRSGKPCPARERRASSAPACRTAARSWSLRGCRALPPGVLVPSARPAAGVRAVRADARTGPGTGRPPGQSLTGTAPGPAHTPASPAGPDRAARAGVPPPVPVPVPGARPAGHAHQSGDVRPVIGGLAERQPWRGAGCVPRVRSWRRAGRPAIGRGRMRPVRPIDHAGGFIRPGPVTGIVRGGSGAGLAGQEAGACPFRPVVARSHADGRSFAGHGSASRPVCRPGWSSAERSARAGCGSAYAVSRSVAVRQACSTARSRTATRVSRAAMAWRLRRP
jgi:hypothetical protein